jgi:hypothetical protein
MSYPPLFNLFRVAQSFVTCVVFSLSTVVCLFDLFHWAIFIPPLHRSGVYCFTSVRPSVRPSFRPRYFSSHFSQQLLMAEIWYCSQASYRYPILWEAFLDPSDSYFLFVDLVGFYTHLTYMQIFRRIFLSNYWWQESDIRSQASYMYPILWEAFLDSSYSYFLFSDLVGFYTHWTYLYAHFSSHFSKQLLMTGIWYLVTSFI